MDIPLFLNFYSFLSQGYFSFPFFFLLLSSFLLFLLFLLVFSFFNLLLVSYSKSQSIILFKVIIENINSNYPLLLNLYLSFILLPYIIIIFPPLFLTTYKIINYKINKRIYTYAGGGIALISSIGEAENIITKTSYKINNEVYVSRDAKDYLKNVIKEKSMEVAAVLPSRDYKFLNNIKNSNSTKLKEHTFRQLQYENKNNPNYLHSNSIFCNKYKNNESLQDAIEASQASVAITCLEGYNSKYLYYFLKAGIPSKGADAFLLKCKKRFDIDIKETLINSLEDIKTKGISYEVKKQVSKLREDTSFADNKLIEEGICEFTAFDPNLNPNDENTNNYIGDNLINKKLKYFKHPQVLNDNYEIKKDLASYNLFALLNSPYNYSSEDCKIIENRASNYVKEHNNLGLDIPIKINALPVHPDKNKVMIKLGVALEEIYNAYK